MALAKAVKDLGITYPVALDPKGKTLMLYAKGASIPLTFVIGADGKIKYRHQNFTPGDETGLEKAIVAQIR